MRILVVKCPHCSMFFSLSRKELMLHESSEPFVLDINCKKCGNSFSTLDTSESDYVIAEADLPFDVEFILSEFREEESEIFGSDGKVYGGIRVGNSSIEKMRDLINLLEKEFHD